MRFVQFRIWVSFPFLSAVERRNGTVVVTMVSVRLENAERYLPDVPERRVSVGIATGFNASEGARHVRLLGECS